MIRYSRVAGTGSYLPEKIVTNKDLESRIDTTDEWIRSRTGIERRHIAAPDETSSSLAEHAARRALKAAGLTPADVDFIVVGTTTPDLIFPNTGTLLQQRLDIHGCPAFSLETACSGFVYALSIADKFVRLGESKCALVVGVECLSRFIDWTDRGTCVLFGDGAGAVVLTPADEPGIIGTHLHSDGKYKDLLYFPYGVSRGFEKLRNNSTDGLKMQGNEVFKVAVRTLSKLVDETLAKNGVERGDIDWLDPAPGESAHHPVGRRQARVADGESRRHRAEPRQHVGRLDSARLDTAVRDGRIHRGQLLLLETFGGGFTWGSALIRY